MAQSTVNVAGFCRNCYARNTTINISSTFNPLPATYFSIIL